MKTIICTPASKSSKCNSVEGKLLKKDTKIIAIFFGIIRMVLSQKETDKIMDRDPNWTMIIGARIKIEHKNSIERD